MIDDGSGTVAKHKFKILPTSKKVVAPVSAQPRRCASRENRCASFCYKFDAMRLTTGQARLAPAFVLEFQVRSAALVCRCHNLLIYIRISGLSEVVRVATATLTAGGAVPSLSRVDKRYVC